MDSPAADPVGSTSAFADELLGIMEDAGVRRLALHRAGSPDLAEDALNEAYCAVAAVREPARIENLKAYFCKVLINETARLRREMAIPAGDLTEMSNLWQAPASTSDGLERHVHLSLLTEALFARLGTHRDEWRPAIPGRLSNLDGYRAAIPPRSHEPDRYRAVIAVAAEQVLRDAIDGVSGESDSNDAFRAAYPEYFDQPGATPNTLHQRFRRAREDVKALLQTVVSRDELS